jgi:hypothetical protein
MEVEKQQNLQERLENISSAEEKISLCLESMRKSLSESEVPRFKDFWEAKKLCLPLFKEGLSPSARSKLWSEYIELCTQVRHLKEMLDEQSAFAVEQIDLAITALEKDLEQYDQLLLQIPYLLIPEECHTLKEKEEGYVTLQRELFLLNTLAARVNSLRKEVLKTEMRIRFKNKFFERLSKIGDKIFPRRKELIKKVSTDFIVDIQAFVKEGLEETNIPLFALREEIKALQQIAKELTLDTQAFTQTRLELSRFWDLLREKEKEKKKEFTEKKEVFKKNVDLILDKIKPLAERCQNENFSMEEASKQTAEINALMKDLELGRDEVRFLREEIQKAKQPVFDRMKVLEDAREKAIDEMHRQKREKLEQVRKQIEETIQKVDTEEVNVVSKERERLVKELDILTLTPAERELLEQGLKKLRDKILERKEKNLSEADIRSIEELKKVLEERKTQRKEIKTELETYRRALSGSGFDFEKAMRYRELLDEEKTRLDKVNQAIDEIEEKILELEE